MVQQDVNISGDALLELIPQRDPIVMVDCFLGMSGNVSYTGLQIRKDNLFCENEVLQEYGLIEHIAQSAAVRIGYLCHSQGKAIPVGFIGSVDKLTIHALPVVGTILRTEIRIEQEVGDITLISARVLAEENVLVEGRMKIYLNQSGA